MARLPQPGSDSNAWGGILNDFLSQSLTTTGGIKGSALVSAGASVPVTVNIDVSDSPYTPHDFTEIDCCDTSGGTITINAPASPTTGARLLVVNTGGNNIVTLWDGTQLFANYSASYVYDGTGWQWIGGNTIQNSNIATMTATRLAIGDQAGAVISNNDHGTSAQLGASPTSASVNVSYITGGNVAQLTADTDGNAGVAVVGDGIGNQQPATFRGATDAMPIAVNTTTLNTGDIFTQTTIGSTGFWVVNTDGSPQFVGQPMLGVYQYAPSSPDFINFATGPLASLGTHASFKMDYGVPANGKVLITITGTLAYSGSSSTWLALYTPDGAKRGPTISIDQSAYEFTAEFLVAGLQPGGTYTFQLYGSAASLGPLLACGDVGGSKTSTPSFVGSGPLTMKAFGI
jgi:hypothetical protein